MNVVKFSLGELQANCYLLIKNRQCIIVDPADDAGFLLEELQRRNLSLAAMIATHGHFDHIMAAGEIQLSCDVPLYIHKNDLFLVKRLNETARYFLGYDPHVSQPRRISYLDADELKIENFKLKIISTPGHTPGGVCYYFPSEKIIFTGDTLFKQGIGRYDFSYSSRKDLDESIKKILRLPEETTVYSGHGEATTVLILSSRSSL